MDVADEALGATDPPATPADAHDPLHIRQRPSGEIRNPATKSYL